MPPSAWANRPMRVAVAPVNEPRACPNSSDSTRVSGMAAQLTATKGLRARGEPATSDLATSSLPVPDSPGDQHRALGVGHLGDDAQHRGHGRVVAQQPGGGVVAPGERVAGRQRGGDRWRRPQQRTGQRLLQALELERLDQKIARAGPDRPHRVGDLGAAAHDDHRRGRTFAACGLQDLEAVHLRHAQVGEDDVEVLALEAGQAARAVRGDHLERGRSQEAGQPAAQGLFVVTQGAAWSSDRHGDLAVGSRPTTRTSMDRSQGEGQYKPRQCRIFANARSTVHAANESACADCARLFVTSIWHVGDAGRVQVRSGCATCA